MPIQVQPRLLGLGRGHEFRDFAPLEPGTGHQTIPQRARRFGEIARHHEGIGLVEQSILPMARSGLAQHPPKQLLHRRGR